MPHFIFIHSDGCPVFTVIKTVSLPARSQVKLAHQHQELVLQGVYVRGEGDYVVFELIEAAASERGDGIHVKTP
jgi:hypothetical protein